MNNEHVWQDTLVEHTEAFLKIVCTVKFWEHENDILLLEATARVLLLPHPKINANCSMSLGYNHQKQSLWVSKLLQY